MTVAVLIHPFAAATETDTTTLGTSSFLHTLEVLGRLNGVTVSVLAQAQLDQLASASRHRAQHAQAVLHPGRLGSAAAATLAALHVLDQASDAQLLIAQAPLRIRDSEQLQRLALRAEPWTAQGAIVNLTTLLPLLGRPAARHQFLCGTVRDDGSRSVVRSGVWLQGEDPGLMLLHGTGVLLVRASAYLRGMAVHAADILVACRQAMAQARYGRIGSAANGRTTSQHGELSCVWPAAAALLRASAGEIDHKLLPHFQPQVAITCDDIWLPREAPIERRAPCPSRSGQLLGV